MADSLYKAYETLGVTAGASPEEVRSSYLNLVRQYPPDRQPEQFQKIHAAYQMLNDPMVQAKSMLQPKKDAPDLMESIASAAKIRPRLPRLVLLALGNEAS